MVTTYKKAGIDITEIKKSQGAIGQIISSTHKIQKLAKVVHGFGHYAGIVQIPGNKFFFIILHVHVGVYFFMLSIFI